MVKNVASGWESLICPWKNYVLGKILSNWRCRCDCSANSYGEFSTSAAASTACKFFIMLTNFDENFKNDANTPHWSQKLHWNNFGHFKSMYTIYSPIFLSMISFANFNFLHNFCSYKIMPPIFITLTKNVRKISLQFSRLHFKKFFL